MYFWRLRQNGASKSWNKMAEIIKNSEVKVISNCGHMIILRKYLK